MFADLGFLKLCVKQCFSKRCNNNGNSVDLANRLAATFFPESITLYVKCNNNKGACTHYST